MLKSKISDKYALDILFNIIDTSDASYVNHTISDIKDRKLKKLKDLNKINEVSNIPLYEIGKGLPIGNMTSQFLVIFYLNNIDHYIKEDLKIKHYIRYMDDLLLLGNNKKELIDNFNLIKNEIYNVKLEVNNKSRIYN